jgi:hypothetical protein
MLNTLVNFIETMINSMLYIIRWYNAKLYYLFFNYY